MTPRPVVALSALLAAASAASPARADVLDIIVAGRASQDFGTTFVTGTKSGPGAGLGLRASFGDDDVRWEPEVSIDVTGFDGEVDGDPIVEALLLISRRSFFFYGDRGGRPWWSLGAGVGGVLGERGGAAFPARVALGVSLAPTSSVGFEASIFNRFTFVSSRDDRGYINSTGVEIAVRFGR